MGTSKTTINVVVSEKYDLIKQSLIREWYKHNTTSFDEDLFHDTLCKCIVKMGENEYLESEIFNYIFIAFKQNTMREGMYHRNSMKVDTEITYIGECEQSYDIDYFTIISDIREKFGVELFEAFSDWVDGESVSSIEKRRGLKGLAYQFKKISKWIKSKYQLI